MDGEGVPLSEREFWETRPVFELRYPDGRHVRLYADGRVGGVPEGTAIINRVPAMRVYLEASGFMEDRITEDMIEAGSEVLWEMGVEMLPYVSHSELAKTIIAAALRTRRESFAALSR